MTILSSFREGDLVAETFIDKGDFGAIFYNKHGEKIGEEKYIGHSEDYAESAAENYVLGIKKV
tara:strand:- start:1003 stop:1191 length:189 start_codon:yes stop_codon:yes gene_type:complete